LFPLLISLLTFDGAVEVNDDDDELIIVNNIAINLALSFSVIFNI
jgi:hypothetical protein